MGHFTYLIFNLLTIAVILVFSFYKKINFINNFRHFIFAIVLTLLIYIPLDMTFTALGIWKFNFHYTLGIVLGNLPIEEYLIFISLPVLFLLIYEYIKVFIKKDYLRGTHFSFTPLAAIGLTILLINNFDKTYTAISTAFFILLLLIQLIKLKRYMSWFYKTLLVSLIPLFIINLILTNLPIIIYNSKSILGIKIFTIPVENFIYFGGMLLLVIMGYEYSKRKFISKSKLKEV